jgi:hypothetical protein
MSILPVALKGFNFFMTLELSSSEIDKGESFPGGYTEFEISERSVIGMGGKYQAFRALVLTEGVEALLLGVTRVGIKGRVGERLLCVFAHFASGQMPLLNLVALTIASLKCKPLAFLIPSPFTKCLQVDPPTFST